jgi:regulator of CtrA degradation
LPTRPGPISTIPGATSARTLDPYVRVSFACESLKVTTRIMHIVAWLLTQRAIESGEIGYREGRRPERRLGHAQESDPSVVAKLPATARHLVSASTDLYVRVKRLDEGSVVDEPPGSPARALMGRLERGLSGHQGCRSPGPSPRCRATPCSCPTLPSRTQ